jgi:hypothetical protein
MAVRGSVIYFAVYRETHGMSGFVQVFGRRQRRSDHALRRPASEKRQGTAVPQKGYGDLVAGQDLQRFGSVIRVE